MIKSCLLTHSIAPYPKDIQEFSVRGYKYLRNVHQTEENNISKHFSLKRFLKKLKMTKKMKKLMINTDLLSFNSGTYAQNLRSVLQSHPYDIKNLDISDFSWFQSVPYKRHLCLTKNVEILNLKCKKAEIRYLKTFRMLKSLFLDFTDFEVPLEGLYSALTKLKNLERLNLSVNKSDLSDILQLLDRLVTAKNKRLNIEIITFNGDGNYHEMPDISNLLGQMITKLHVADITTNQFLAEVFKSAAYTFQNLKILQLELDSSDLSLTKHLKMLTKMSMLENLALNITGHGSKEFSAGVIRTLRLPALLQDLEIKMPLSLEDYILNNVNLIRSAKEKYPWRAKNYFEEESALISFFKAFEKTKLLKNLTLEFKMLESFSSYYTSFFISILDRLPQVRSFSIFVEDYGAQRSKKGLSEYFDLSLLFDSSSKMTNLEELEVVMPNLLFDNMKLSTNLNHLKEFHVGISGQDAHETTQTDAINKFSNISKYVGKSLKILASQAPNLKSLILDFRETLDERMLYKRFKVIQRLKNLEYLYLNLIVPTCSNETVHSVGKILQSLKRMKTSIFMFTGSDHNTFSLKTYLRYQKSLKEAVLLSNMDEWMLNV